MRRKSYRKYELNYHYHHRYHCCCCYYHFEQSYVNDSFKLNCKIQDQDEKGSRAEEEKRPGIISSMEEITFQQRLQEIN